MPAIKTHYTNLFPALLKDVLYFNQHEQFITAIVQTQQQ